MFFRAGITFRRVFIAVMFMNPKHGLSHEKLSLVGLADGKPQHASDQTCGSVYRFAKATAAKVIAGLATTTYVPPKPEKILPVVRARSGIFAEHRIATQSSGAKIFTDQKSVRQFWHTV